MPIPTFITGVSIIDANSICTYLPAPTQKVNYVTLGSLLKIVIEQNVNFWSKREREQD